MSGTSSADRRVNRADSKECRTEHSGWRSGLAQHGDEASAPLHVGGGADVVDGAGACLDQPPCGGDGGGFGIVAHDDQGRLDALQARGNDGFAALGEQDASVALELGNPIAKTNAAPAIIDFLAHFEPDAVTQIAGSNPGHQSGLFR